MSATRNSILALGLVIITAISILIYAKSSNPKNVALTARQQAMEMLGEQIAKLRPESKVLVLSNPFTKKSGYFEEKAQFERAGISGLRKGLGRGSSIEVVYPEIRPEYYSSPQSIMIPPDSRTPLSFLIQPGSVEKLAESNPKHLVIVSLIGLPVGVDQLKIWQEKDPHCFALLSPDLRLLGVPAKAIEAFQRGKLLAVVINDMQSGNPMVVTRDNVVEVLKRQPKALGY